MSWSLVVLAGSVFALIGEVIAFSYICRDRRAPKQRRVRGRRKPRQVAETFHGWKAAAWVGMDFEGHLAFKPASWAHNYYTCTDRFICGCERGAHSQIGPDTSCGFYAMKDRENVSLGSILLEVALGGCVVVGERGYRAEYQQVLGVWVHSEEEQRQLAANVDGIPVRLMEPRAGLGQFTVTATRPAPFNLRSAGWLIDIPVGVPLRNAISLGSLSEEIACGYLDPPQPST